MCGLRCEPGAVIGSAAFIAQVKKALDPPPPPKEPRSPEYGSAGIRPPSPPAPISTGRLRAAPQRLDASVLVEPLYGKGGPAREASAREESKAAPEAAAKAPAASAPARGIGVGSRVQDSEGTCGEIVARSGAWLTMRTDAGEERKMRKADLELITRGAPTVAPTSAGDAGGAQAAASDRKQGARGASQKARKRGRAAVESTDESASPSDQSEAGELLTSRV